MQARRAKRQVGKKARAQIRKTMPDRISEALELLETAVHDKEEQARELMEENFVALKDKTTEGVQYVEDSVRARPWQSLAVTAAGGCVLGYLLGRRAS